VLEIGKEKDWKRVSVCSQDSARLGTPDCPVVHRTVSGGAPDSVRCARPTPMNWPLSGKLRWCTTIIHQTVRWCTGLSGEPTATKSAGDAWPAPTVGRDTGLSGVHRTVSGAPTDTRVATVGCARLGRRSTPDMLQCLSGAPPDRR
jgi:hypothetical protein